MDNIEDKTKLLQHCFEFRSNMLRKLYYLLIFFKYFGSKRIESKPSRKNQSRQRNEIWKLETHALE